MSGRVQDASNTQSGCLHQGYFDSPDSQSSSIHCNFCRNCGVAFVSNGFMKRPRRFEHEFFDAATSSALLESMSLKQHANRPTNDRLINAPLRRATVQCLANLRDKTGVSQITFAKSLGIMDKFISENRVRDFDYNIIMVTAYNIASKLNENESKVLSLAEITYHFEDTLNLNEVQDWETKMLSALRWKIDVVTAKEFAELFLSFGVVGELEVPKNQRSRNHVEVNLLLQCIDELVDYVLQSTCNEFGFHMFEPSQLAASAIALARLLVGLEHWSLDLQTITRVTSAAIERCLPFLEVFIKSNPFWQGIKTILRQTSILNTALNQKRNPVVVPVYRVLVGEESLSESPFVNRQINKKRKIKVIVKKIHKKRSLRITRTGKKSLLAQIIQRK